MPNLMDALRLSTSVSKQTKLQPTTTESTAQHLPKPGYNIEQESNVTVAI